MKLELLDVFKMFIVALLTLVSPKILDYFVFLFSSYIYIYIYIYK